MGPDGEPVLLIDRRQAEQARKGKQSERLGEMQMLDAGMMDGGGAAGSSEEEGGLFQQAGQGHGGFNQAGGFLQAGDSGDSDF